MRLLLTADSVGGVWQYATDLARALQPHGIVPILAVLGPPPSPDQRAAAEGLTVIETGLPLDWLAGSPSAVKAAAKAVAALAAPKRVDLVQLNTPALAVADYPVRVVAVAHSCVATWWDAVIGGDMPDDLRWRADLHAAGLRRADRVVTPSACFAEATRRIYRLQELPTTVHNGRAPWSLPPVAPGASAFTAGRLWDAGKDVATLDRAAAAMPMPLHAAGPLTGPNGDIVTLANMRALGVLGDAELAAQLAARPVFVSAALYEPFGLAVLEAAQAGCPLVLSDIPTFRELWDEAAIFVAPRDADGFAAAMSGLCDDSAVRAEWGGKAAGRASRYTVEAMASGMTSIYRDLLGRGAERAKAAA